MSNRLVFSLDFNDAIDIFFCTDYSFGKLVRLPVNSESPLTDEALIIFGVSMSLLGSDESRETGPGIISTGLGAYNAARIRQR